jgi:hypothetical protein
MKASMIAARIQVEHHGHVQPALSRPDLGEVGNSLVVSGCGLKLPVQQVIRQDAAFAPVRR